MRTREEIERVLAAIEDAVLKTDHISKAHANEYGTLYDLRRLLLWVLDGGLSPAEWAIVKAARNGAFTSKVNEEAREIRRKLQEIVDRLR